MFYIFKALTGKWGEYHYHPAFHHRLFYRLKSAICLLLNREPSCAVYSDPYFVQEMIHITWTDGGVSPGTVHGPAVYWGECIIVGPGFWRGWWSMFHSESSD